MPELVTVVEEVTVVSEDGTIEVVEVGIVGDPGTDGDDGSDGATWHTSGFSGVTDYTDVDNPTTGDHFLYPGSGDVFRYDGSDWAYVGSLKGPAGPAPDLSVYATIAALGALETEVASKAPTAALNVVSDAVATLSGNLDWVGANSLKGFNNLSDVVDKAAARRSLGFTSESLALGNMDAVNMKPWRDALVRAQRNSGFARALVVGTSSTFGIGPSSESHHWVRVLAETMRARTGIGEASGLLVNTQNFISPGRTYTSAGAGWSADLGGSIGDLGNMQGANGAAGALTYTHPHCDRFTVWFTSGNFTLQIDGETAVTGVTGSPGQFNSHTIVSSNGVGPHTLTIKDPVSGTARPYYIEAHTGTTGDLRIANMGVSGAVSADFDNAVEFYDGLPFIDHLNPDLVILQIGGNDVTAEVPVATFKARLKTAAQYVWDNTPATVVLIEPIEEHGNAIDSTYGEAVREIADEIGCMTFSVTDAMLGAPADYVDPGNQHFDNDGHLLWARSLAAALVEC